MSVIFEICGGEPYCDNQKGNYEKSIDSLEKANMFFMKDIYQATRSALCNYYIGRSFIALEQEEKSILYYKKVDSILNITNLIMPELTGIYKPLIESTKQNKEQQIK